MAAHDVASPEARAAIAAFRPTALLHLAAQGGVNRSWREPALDATINVAGSVSMLHAARACGCARFVLASSGGAVYGAPERVPTPEDSVAAPRSPYGTAKVAAEHYLRLFCRDGGMAGAALRYGNVYGPGQDGTGEAGVVAITCHRLIDGQAPLVRGDGEQTRDFVHVQDVVRANVRALQRADSSGALNIGTGRATSVRRVVEVLCGAAGYRGPWERAELPPGEVRDSRLDVTRAEAVLGWTPRTSIEDGLTVTLEHFRVARG